MRSLALNVEQRQQQTLSPRLQQAVRLLQLSSLDFAQEVQNAVGNNPFLEVDETTPESAPPADGAVTSAAVLPSVETSETAMPVNETPGNGEAVSESDGGDPYSDAASDAAFTLDDGSDSISGPSTDGGDCGMRVTGAQPRISFTRRMSTP